MRKLKAMLRRLLGWRPMPRSLTACLLVPLLYGCQSRQYLRFVPMDCYKGIQTMQTDSLQAGREARTRYDALYNFTKDRLAADMTVSNEDKDDTMADLATERDEFRKSTELNTRVDKMGDEVLYGIGWEEGPHDPLPVIGALAIGAGVGAVAVAAF